MGPHHSKDKSDICMTCKVVGVEREAQAVCVDCVEPLCSDCVRDHRKNKASRNHNIHEGKNIQEDFHAFKSIKSMVSCQEHPEEEVSIKCIDHMEFICRKCHFANHIICNVKELGSVGNVKISDEIVKNSMDVLKDVHTATVSSRNLKEQNIKMLVAKKNALKQERDSVLRKFKKLNDELERKIESLVSEEKDALEWDIDEYKGTEAEVKLNETVIHKVVESGNSVWIELVSDFVMKKANEIKDKTNSHRSKKATALNFKPSQSFLTLKQMSSLGCIEMISEGGEVSPVINDTRINSELCSNAVEETDTSTCSHKGVHEVPGSK